MIFKKQNDETALTYLKAAIYCNKKEKAAKFCIIILSVIVCLLGIFNKNYKFLEMLDEILFPNSSATGSLWVVVISGTVMIVNSFLSIKAKRYSIEGTNFMEKYDNYVYGIPENILIMRPISPIIIDNYSRKVKNKDNRYNNYYYKKPEKAERKNAVLENQFKLFKDQYKLLLYVKGFFQTIWILFFVGVVIISVNFDDTFVSTLANILIPSLSVILLIVSSWHSMSEETRYLQNCINTLENVKKDGEDGLNSRIFLRSVQDAVFKFRSSEFLVPNILKNRFEKLEEKTNANFSANSRQAMIQNKPEDAKTPAKENAEKYEKDKQEQNSKVATAVPEKSAKAGQAASAEKEKTQVKEKKPSVESVKEKMQDVKLAKKTQEKMTDDVKPSKKTVIEKKGKAETQKKKTVKAVKKEQTENAEGTQAQTK